MAEYLYTRILDTVTNLYNIDYPGEIIRLSEEIKINILNKTLIKTECDETELKIIIEPNLTAGEQTTLDNLVLNHV